MECKCPKPGRNAEGGKEIIETYWNVNEVAEEPAQEEQPEIIETYWNVNHCGVKAKDFPIVK